jgi:hypothetical protein
VRIHVEKDISNQRRCQCGYIWQSVVSIHVKKKMYLDPTPLFDVGMKSVYRSRIHGATTDKMVMPI